MKYGLSLMLLLSACASKKVITESPKIYMHAAENAAFIRLQGSEIVPYEQAQQWIAMPPDSFESLLLRCVQPE